MNYKVITPAAAVVTLPEARLHLRVDADQAADDAKILSLVAAATSWCETQARRAFGTQTLRSYADVWPCDGVLHLPMPALQSVTSVKYYDTDGVLQTLDSSKYQVDTVSEPGRLLPAPGESWPALQSGRVNTVEVEHVAGWGNPAAVDARAKEAILFLVGHWYANREAVVTGTIVAEVQHALTALLSQLWHGRLP